MLTRRTPLKRTQVLRRAAKKTDAPQHLAYLRTLQCCVPATFPWLCSGPIEAHHSTLGRGLSQKSSDLDAMPICSKHHAELHSFCGYFMKFTRQIRADWQRAMSERYRPKKESA